MSPKSNKKPAAGVGDANNFDLDFLQSGLTLYHRRECNRHLQVQISEDKQMDKVTTGIENTNQIPCEIVGLDAKKSKKPIKVRFHPEVLNVAKRNEGVAKSVYKTVKKLIDDFLGQDWTMERPKIDEIPTGEVDALRKTMLAEHLHMRFDEHKTEFRWHISTPPSFLLGPGESGGKPKAKKRNGKKSQPPTPALAQFELHVHAPTPPIVFDSTLKELNAEKSSTPRDELAQRVELRLTVGSAVHVLFTIDFHSFYPLVVADSGKENDHFARFHPQIGQLEIRLKHSGERPASFYGQSGVSISGFNKKMIDCAQIRLETLRHHVKQNHLRQQQRKAPSRTSTQQSKPARPPIQLPENVEDCGPIAAAFHPNQRVALFQLTNTSRPVQMSRFTVIPVATNHADVPLRTPHSNFTATRPLHVRVVDESRSSAKAAYAEFSGSPADSGVVMSGDDDEDTLSPLPSTPTDRFHFNATAHRAPDVQPHFRARSSSECWDFRDYAPPTLKNTVPTKIQLVSMNATTYASTLSMNSISSSTASLSPNGTPLRSILKKPRFAPPPGLGNTTVQTLNGASGMRRVQTRYVLSRSVSECQDEAGGMILDASAVAANFALLDEEVVSMEDLTVAASVNGSPLSVCAEVDEAAEESDEPEKPTAEQQRKKRVSFNEQVQARIYRSSSSILANKNKQERRARNRQRRRTESECTMDGVEETETTPAALLYVPTIPLAKLSAEEKSESFDSDTPDEFDTPRRAHPNDPAGQLHERRDSGIETVDPIDSGVESPAEECVQMGGKRVQRVVSADSAYGGDDTEMI